MTYLLDTCILLWALEGNLSRLGSFAQLIQNEDHFIFVSVVSYWEIVIKQSLGKLILQDDILKAVNELGFVWMGVEIKHIDQLRSLPYIHHDPFDRLLISQSRAESIQLLTHDHNILQYDQYL